MLMSYGANQFRAACFTKSSCVNLVKRPAAKCALAVSAEASAGQGGASAVRQPAKRSQRVPADSILLPHLQQQAWRGRRGGAHGSQQLEACPPYPDQDTLCSWRTQRRRHGGVQHQGTRASCCPIPPAAPFRFPTAGTHHRHTSSTASLPPPLTLPHSGYQPTACLRSGGGR